VTAPFTSNQTTLVDTINTPPFAYGGFTPLWDAAYDSVTLLSTRSEANKAAGILTDGLNNTGSETANSANLFVRKENVKVYGLGFGSASASQLDALVIGTGGYRDLIDVNDPDASIANLLDNIFAATQAQGCIDLTFAPPPASGVRIKGSVSMAFGFSPSTAFDCPRWWPWVLRAGGQWKSPRVAMGFPHGWPRVLPG
jgi:hypothetical protein